MKFNKSKEIGAYIPTASMADIAFLLIIFFMVSAVFPIDKTQVDLPDTRDVKDYSEDSAVITVTTNRLNWVRRNTDRSMSDEYDDVVEVFIRGSDGKNESYEIHSHRAESWDMTDPGQYNELRSKIKDFLKKVERRREIEDRMIIIVLKIDSKTPFYAVDGLLQALQELGGDSAQAIAILSEKEG